MAFISSIVEMDVAFVVFKDTGFMLSFSIVIRGEKDVSEILATVGMCCSMLSFSASEVLV